MLYCVRPHPLPPHKILFGRSSRTLASGHCDQCGDVLRAREAEPIFRMTFPSQTAGEYVERRDKDIVRRVLAKRYRPEAGTDGPSWLSFTGHVKDSLWSVDLFRCESILLRSHWVMVVMDVFTRRIIGFGVERADPCGVSVCRMFNQIIAGKSLPRHLSSDHDPLFYFHRWLANLRILEVEEIKSIPYAPVSHPFVERLIGTIRREVLDRALIWNAVDLWRKMEAFRNYYNENRVHQSLSGSTPGERSGQPPPAHAVLDHYAWRYHCRGLFQMPIAA